MAQTTALVVMHDACSAGAMHLVLSTSLGSALHAAPCSACCAAAATSRQLSSLCATGLGKHLSSQPILPHRSTHQLIEHDTLGCHMSAKHKNRMQPTGLGHPTLTSSLNTMHSAFLPHSTEEGWMATACPVAITL